MCCEVNFEVAPFHVNIRHTLCTTTASNAGLQISLDPTSYIFCCFNIDLRHEVIKCYFSAKNLCNLCPLSLSCISRYMVWMSQHHGYIDRQDENGLVGHLSVWQKLHYVHTFMTPNDLYIDFIPQCIEILHHAATWNSATQPPMPPTNLSEQCTTAESCDM